MRPRGIYTRSQSIAWEGEKKCVQLPIEFPRSRDVICRGAIAIVKLNAHAKTLKRVRPLKVLTNDRYAICAVIRG